MEPKQMRIKRSWINKSNAHHDKVGKGLQICIALKSKLDNINSIIINLSSNPWQMQQKGALFNLKYEK